MFVMNHSCYRRYFPRLQIFRGGKPTSKDPSHLPRFFVAFKLQVYIQRQIQDFPKGGVCGLSRVWIFHTWTFCSGTFYAVHGQHVGGQNTWGQNVSQNCKGGTKCWPFYGTGRAKCQSYQNTLYMILMVR